MPIPLRQYSDLGVIGADGVPTLENGQLYVTPEEALQVYGMSITEAQIRFAMSIIHSTCNRTSIWPEQYKEQLSVAEGRNQVVLGVTPVLRLIQAQGRYGYGRRNRRHVQLANADYLAAYTLMGNANRFEVINVDNIDLDVSTGNIWLPVGLFRVGYSEIEITYLAGYPEVPARVKSALLEIINEICTRQSSSRMSYSVGRTSQRYSTSGFVSEQAYAFLEPYIVRALF